MIVDGETTRTTMRLPTELVDEFKHLAIDRRTTVTALFIEAMEQYLQKAGKRKERDKK